MLDGNYASAQNPACCSTHPAHVALAIVTAGRGLDGFVPSVRSGPPICSIAEPAHEFEDRFDLVIFDWAGTMWISAVWRPSGRCSMPSPRKASSSMRRAARRDMGKSKIDHVRSLLAYPEVALPGQSQHGRPADERDIPVLDDPAGRSCVSMPQRVTLIPGARETFERLRQQVCGLRPRRATRGDDAAGARTGLGTGVRA